MDFLKALERNLAFKTEYGAGPRILGGLAARRFLKRKRYSTDGRTVEDDIHERTVKLGPVAVEHRSKNPELIGNDDYELAVTFLKIFSVSNDKDYWVKLRLGPSLGVLKTFTPPPTSVAGAFVDCDVTARTGLRLNVSGLIRDLKDEEPEEGKSDRALWDGEEDDEFDF